MSSSALAAGIRHLRGKMAVQQRCDDSDEQLLYAFTARRDDDAFAVLVRRHGPMVLHVCRRVLGHEQDAEDAFQATFLVLARNAASLRNKTALASFLHGTAYRMAMKAKQSAARHRQHEGCLGARRQPRSPVDPADELSWREARGLLDEEIDHLPEKYRSVFVLFHLEDVSREETARRLGLKDATVAKRLAEARKRLAQRLARRGVELTAVLATATLAAPAASALPVGLIASTIKAATAAGEGLTGIVSASVAELIKGATAAMLLTKTKMATVILLAASLLGGAGVWAYRGLAAYTFAPSVLASPAQEPPAAKANDKPQAMPPQRAAVKTVEIQGRVLDPDGKPKAGAKILLLRKPHQLGVTGADGRFRIALPKDMKDGVLIAQAEGCGIDFLDLSKGEPKMPLEFRLVKDQAIRGRIVTTEGKPVVGCRVAVDMLGVYANNSLDSFLAEWKIKQRLHSGVPSGEKQIWEAGALLAAPTDADGRFVIHGVGAERFISLRLSGAGIADAKVWVVNRPGFDPKPYNEAFLNNTSPFERDAHPKSKWQLHGPDLSIVAETGKTIRGVVKDADSGKGRPGIVVHLTRWRNIHQQKLLLDVPLQTKTDAEGRYEIHGARKDKWYMVEVSGDPATGYLPSQVWATDTAGYQPITADIPMKRGVIVTGKMLDSATGKPVPGHVMIAVLNNNPFVKDYPVIGDSASFPMIETGADGAFRVVAIPGHVLLMGGPDDWTAQSKYKPAKTDPKYPQYFDNRIPDFPAYYRPGGSMSPVQGSWCKVLDIKADAKIVEQDIVLRAGTVPARAHPGCRG